LTFTYVELIDKTNYLNHYYFVSIIAFLMVWLPAHRYFSVDAALRPSLRSATVPAWAVNVIRLQLALVYFFAGAAKLNADWLLHAQPLSIWLPANSHVPVIGQLFHYKWAAFAFSWAGAAYDLCIPFLLWNRRTRPLAYVAVIAFHALTLILFQIGMFPYIMMLSTLIFFSDGFHERLLGWLRKAWQLLGGRQSTPTGIKTYMAWQPKALTQRLLLGLLTAHLVLQLLLPWRYLLYPGNLFWNEEGYRLSWRVMLMEKAGYAIFTVTDPDSGRRWEINNFDYLTPNQEKMMATQPDMIVQFAHFIEEQLQAQGVARPEIRAKCYVTLNGRPSRLLINPEVDLTKIERSYAHQPWVLPFTETKAVATEQPTAP